MCAKCQSMGFKYHWVCDMGCNKKIASRSDLYDADRNQIWPSVSFDLISCLSKQNVKKSWTVYWLYCILDRILLDYIHVYHCDTNCDDTNLFGEDERNENEDVVRREK